MRVWLDTDRLTAFRLTPGDVETALRAQNVELPAGRLESKQQNLSLRIDRAFRTAADFRALVIGRGGDGYLVRLGDVARIEEGAENLYTGATVNLYSQIGIVMLVGLAAKNGILIVKFANQLRDEGLSLDRAIRDAAARRLRPILMTSIATVCGAVPLAVGDGAGAGPRGAIGVVIVSGVSCATIFTLFVIPLLYTRLARRTGLPLTVGRRLDALLATHAQAPGAGMNFSDHHGPAEET